MQVTIKAVHQVHLAGREVIVPVVVDKVVQVVPGGKLARRVSLGEQVIIIPTPIPVSLHRVRGVQQVHLLVRQ